MKAWLQNEYPFPHLPNWETHRQIAELNRRCRGVWSPAPRVFVVYEDQGPQRQMWPWPWENQGGDSDSSSDEEMNNDGKFRGGSSEGGADSNADLDTVKLQLQQALG